MPSPSQDSTCLKVIGVQVCGTSNICNSERMEFNWKYLEHWPKPESMTVYNIYMEGQQPQCCLIKNHSDNVGAISICKHSESDYSTSSLSQYQKYTKKRFLSNFKVQFML